MGSQKINTRLTFTMIVQLAVLAAITLLAYIGMNRTGNAVNQINQLVVEGNRLGSLDETLHTELLDTVNNVSRGAITWEEAGAALPEIKKKYQDLWQEYSGALAEGEKAKLQEDYKEGLGNIEELFAQLEKLLGARDRAQLNLFIVNELDALLDPFFKALESSREASQQASQEAVKLAERITNRLTVLIVVIALLGIAVAFGLGSIT